MNKYLNALVYNKRIPGEIAKPDSYKCFLGAWCYKVLSSKDKWLGIEAIIELPEFIPDENRFSMIQDNIYDKKLKRYDDTPSIYVGLCSDYENDVGFAWQRGIVDGVVTDDKITFRPFWRYIYEENGEEKNVYQGTNLNLTQYYYFPGDRVKLSLISIKNNYLKLIVELISSTTIKKYLDIRKKLDKTPMDFMTEEFLAPGVGIRPSEVKRVNAIDQYSNEGKPTLATNAKVKECVWEDVYLFREIDGAIRKVPYTKDRYIKMLCPKEDAFIIKEIGNKEIVVINPNRN